ncbi:hypothetical protein HK405_005302 [Cladochytrium tenue]|nr:hypothetical protein HK405_005302 [Cladochytrium tenue]
MLSGTTTNTGNPVVPVTSGTPTGTSAPVTGSSSSALSVPAMAGIVAGVAVVVLAVLVAILAVYRNHRKGSQPELGRDAKGAVAARSVSPDSTGRSSGGDEPNDIPPLRPRQVDPASDAPGQIAPFASWDPPSDVSQAEAAAAVQATEKLAQYARPFSPDSWGAATVKRDASTGSNRSAAAAAAAVASGSARASSLWAFGAGHSNRPGSMASELSDAVSTQSFEAITAQPPITSPLGRLVLATSSSAATPAATTSPGSGLIHAAGGPAARHSAASLRSSATTVLDSARDPLSPKSTTARSGDGSGSGGAGRRPLSWMLSPSTSTSAVAPLASVTQRADLYSVQSADLADFVAAYDRASTQPSTQPSERY